MEVITINNKNYVKGDYVLSNAPVYSKGCRSSRDVIRRKNISCDNFIYARFENNVWNATNGKSVKFDKVMILESFVKTIAELNVKEDVKVVILDDDGIEKAPKIIYLNDEEKFKNDKGEIIEIETRGNRKVDEIYFKVKDVEVGFEMVNLQKTILINHTSYKLKIDYIYFMCEKNNENYKNNKIKKSMFFSLNGFLRMLFCSRIINNLNSNIIINWAHNILNKSEIDDYTIQNNIINNEGYVYCITSELSNSVKIGYWKKSLNSLHGRYATYYGKNLQCYAVRTLNPELLEKKCHTHFSNYKISNELFKKEYNLDYIEYLKNHKF